MGHHPMGANPNPTINHHNFVRFSPIFYSNKNPYNSNQQQQIVPGFNMVNNLQSSNSLKPDHMQQQFKRMPGAQPNCQNFHWPRATLQQAHPGSCCPEWRKAALQNPCPNLISCPSTAIQEAAQPCYQDCQCSPALQKIGHPSQEAQQQFPVEDPTARHPSYCWNPI